MPFTSMDCDCENGPLNFINKLVGFFTLLGDFRGEIAILFGVCCIAELNEVPITPPSEMVTVLGGVPGLACDKTLPAEKAS